MAPIVAVALVAAMAAACSPGISPVPPSATPAATTAPTAEAPSATASASAAALDLGSAPTPLEPGRYTRAGFEPPIAFTLDDGWSIGSVANGFFDVQQRKGTPEVIAVQFGTVGSVIGDGGTAAQPTSAEDAAARISENPGLQTLDRSDSRLGGQTGVVVEVENAGSAHAPILEVRAGRLGIDPGRRLWIALFDTADGLLAVMVGGPADGWEDALGIAEPVLESIVIGG
jgi:hypothetical protein